MNVAPSLDITHDHWDDVNVLNNALTPAAAVVSPPSKFLRPGASTATGTSSVGVRDAAPPKPSASLLSIVDSQLEESDQCAAIPGVTPTHAPAPLPLALDGDSNDDVIGGVSGSATDAPLGSVRTDSEELPMEARPRPAAVADRRIPLPETPLGDADDSLRDMPSSQMPLVPKPRQVAMSRPPRRRRVSEATQPEATKKARTGQSDSDVVVDGSINEDDDAASTAASEEVAEKIREEKVSPTPATPSNPLSVLFKGISFILTGLSEPEPPQTPKREVTYEEPATQLTQSQAPKKAPEPPLPESAQLRAEIMGLIASTGGTIIEKVPDKCKTITTPFGSLSSVIVLASRPARTQKYLSALLHGVPTVKFTWLKQCIDAGCLISPTPHMLPAGHSLETDMDVYHTSFVPNILEDVRIELSGTPTMSRVWSELLRIAGARVILDGLLKDRHVDVLLVARNPQGIGTWVAPEVLSQARKKKTPAVTTEWIIQCVINQKKVPVNRADYLFSADE